jgi:hypothetical protein
MTFEQCGDLRPLPPQATSRSRILFRAFAPFAFSRYKQGKRNAFAESGHSEKRRPDAIVSHPRNSVKNLFYGGGEQAVRASNRD